MKEGTFACVSCSSLLICVSPQAAAASESGTGAAEADRDDPSALLPTVYVDADDMLFYAYLIFL